MPFPSTDANLSETVVSSLKTLLFETPLSDGRPLFESPSELAGLLADFKESHYKRKKSTEALLSQILRSIRPIPQHLVTDIINLLNSQAQSDRQCLFRSSPTVAMIQEAAERHNREVSKDSDARGIRYSKFKAEIAEFRTQIVFVTDNIFTASASATSPWNELLHQQAGLLTSRAVDTKIHFFATRASVAYRIWDLLHEETQVQRGLKTKTEERFDDASNIIAEANGNGSLRVYVIDKKSVLPCIVSQVAFFPKTAPTVYMIIANSLLELGEQESAQWSKDIQSIYPLDSTFIEISWEMYARAQGILKIVGP